MITKGEKKGKGIIKRKYFLKMTCSQLDDFAAYCHSKHIRYEVDYMKVDSMRCIDVDEMIAVIIVYMTRHEMEKLSDDLLNEGITNFSYSY